VVKPSRSLFVAHPFGLTFGQVHATATQAAVLDAMFDAAVNMDAPGIRVAPFTWDEDNLRHRQLRKQRH
jgi:hypothetical protein